MGGLKFIFEKGGVLFAEFFKYDSNAIKNITKILPIKTEIYHTRWCGREIYMPIRTENTRECEDVTKYVSRLDLVYWIKKGGEKETISLFYGAESLQFYGGPLYVEIIGRVSLDQEDLLDEIGERIWLKGKEKVSIEFYNNE